MFRKAIRDIPWSLLILSVWALMAIIGPFLPLQADQVNLDIMLQGAQWSAWFGYDDLGRPVLHRLVDGAGISYSSYRYFYCLSGNFISYCVGGGIRSWFG